MATAQQIIHDLSAFMRRYPSTKNHHWYVGLASDPRQRLFLDHAVNEQTGAWIFRQADSPAIARQVEAAYHNSGCDGDPGAADHTSLYVYSYLKTFGTKPGQPAPDQS